LSPDEIDDVVEAVDVRKLFAARRLAHHVQDDLPERQLVEVCRNFRVSGDQILKKAERGKAFV
jgi:hypothetical protein